MEVDSRERGVTDTNATHLTIAREHNAVQSDLERIKIKLSSKSTNAAEMNAIGQVLGDKRKELTTLNRELLLIAADPMKSDSLNKPPKAIQSLLDDILSSKDEVERLQAQFNERAGVAAAPPRHTRPEYKPPTMGAPLPQKAPTIGAPLPQTAPTERGLIQTAPPSPEVQSRMEAEAELQRRRGR